MTDTFTNMNDLEDVRAVARSIHAVAAIRRLACRAVADGEITGPQPTALADTLAALDDLVMGLAEDVQATAGEVHDRLKAAREEERRFGNGAAPASPETTSAVAAISEAARKAAAQRLPTSDAVIAAARKAVDAQLRGAAE